jgi:hypothetical protein
MNKRSWSNSDLQPIDDRPGKFTVVIWRAIHSMKNWNAGGSGLSKAAENSAGDSRGEYSRSDNTFNRQETVNEQNGNQIECQAANNSFRKTMRLTFEC